MRNLNYHSVSQNYFESIHFGNQNLLKFNTDYLLTLYAGEAVAVLLFSEAHSSQPQRMLDVTFSSNPTARFLEEVEPSLNSTIVEEIALVRLTVAWASGILFLIAAYIGVSLLPTQNSINLFYPLATYDAIKHHDL